MWKRTSKRLFWAACSALLLWGCQRPGPQTEGLPFQPTVDRVREGKQPGIFYTAYLLQLAHEEHGLVEELWQYLDEDAPQGASRQLRRENNLRIGLLQDRLRAEAEAVLQRMRTEQISAIPIFGPAGKVQFFTCGGPRKSVSLFLWTAEDEVLARSFAQLSLAVEVEAAPVHEKLVELVVTPALLLGLTGRQPIRALRTVVRCPVGGSLVVGAVDPRGEGLGKFFQTTANRPDDRELLLIITLDAVRPARSR